MHSTSNKVCVLYGPTASGKSAAALWIAGQRPSVIINADAMQVYRELRILTARPSEAEEALVPHALYGVLSAREVCSVGRWLDMAIAAVAAAWEAGRLPIVVGGTGMYLKALMEGIAEIPDVPAEVQEAVQAWCLQDGVEALHGWLLEHDPVMAGRLNPTDSQRVQRAVAVLKASGVSLAEWQAKPVTPPYSVESMVKVAMEISRELLYARCDARFEQMLEAGAKAEVQALLEMGLPESLPGMRAVGVTELARMIRGEWTREQAVEKAQQATRNYAKRQLTWLRHQYGRDVSIPYDWQASDEGMNVMRNLLGYLD